jgi:hypothetical protein
MYYKTKMLESTTPNFSPTSAEAKRLSIPSYSQIRPHLVQPAKDAIKVINGLSPAISAWRGK